ncbi:hypothetical protein FRB94_006746 [Tulasnella sp. JGI-2019a]|nr:hypothetical protein FRB93_005527 [Tulasnella sp. JGI-2019a]KAG8998617.1 hypothetical protein FRB94_006746 [Tulasnella sp. JGI-2019a]
MFGPFRGPLPESEYQILKSDYEALYVPFILNDTAVTVMTVASNDRDKSRIWGLSYGHLGYKIANKAGGNRLSYTPWAVPARLIDQDNHVVVTSDSSVEWELVRTSSAGQPRAFQLHIVSGDRLKSTDDIALGLNNGKLHLVTGTSGTSFRFVGITVQASTIPSSLVVNDGTECLIRSVHSPRIALEHLLSVENFVVGRAVSNEASQMWKFEKGANGFKIKNVGTNKYLDCIAIPNTPDTRMSLTCPDNSSDKWNEFIIVTSHQGFELRTVTNTNWLISLWNLDVGNNGWVYHVYDGLHGHALTGAQWIFTEPPRNQ